MSTFVKRFAADQSGATAIEYGLIAALMALVIVAAIGLVGTKTLALFQSVDDKFPAS
jgi:pilus assembly protein Flp/PilA